ncbi:MAG: YHS domain-containing protein [Nitrospirota bacterium]|jgi:YHS domain-containing protein
MPAAKKKANCSVCGTEIKQDSKFKADYKGQTHYFCSSKDKKEFEDRPHVYAGILRVSKTGRAA